MKYVLSDISFTNSLYGSILVELTFSPIKATKAKKIYASCDTDSVTSYEMFFVYITDFSRLQLLEEIKDMEEEIAEKEMLSEDYSEQYDRLCAELEERRKTFVQPTMAGVKLSEPSYRMIANIVENVAKSSAYYGKIVDIEVAGSDVENT